jgi:hypothetical protein
MKTDTKRIAVLDAPTKQGNRTLYPATFGLLEWLQTKRKNPLLTGGKAELKHALELCLAFTMPSADVAKIPNDKIAGMVDDFAHGLTPTEFHRIQKHAETELLKFQETAVGPKKPAPPPRRRKT